MMLKEKIQKDLNDALKSGQQLKRLVLGMLANAIKNRELAKRTQLSKTVKDPSELEKQSKLNDEESVEAIASEVKKRKESIEQFTLGNRPELAKKEKEEMDILMEYLPAQMSETEVEAEVEKVIKENSATGLKDMGRIIGLVMAKLKGRADGGMVSRLVKKFLVN